MGHCNVIENGVFVWKKEWPNDICSCLFVVWITSSIGTIKGRQIIFLHVVLNSDKAGIIGMKVQVVFSSTCNFTVTVSKFNSSIFSVYVFLNCKIDSDNRFCFDISACGLFVFLCGQNANNSGIRFILGGSVNSKRSCEGR
ncbi:uncharacterized protein LOC119981095 isoform X1 [Tripterygium wilfordii]|uniref:uncharacterized protein LOC119981095 isoform X1 n=1 Tax=Tripterygium wilfordii TaxID=458696 RepID=UPI0018F84BF1|nr:uncharacterized protein LOC119981095 isoform X1 [Tripterygium wilfordii]